MNKRTLLAAAVLTISAGALAHDDLASPTVRLNAAGGTITWSAVAGASHYEVFVDNKRVLGGKRTADEPRQFDVADYPPATRFSVRAIGVSTVVSEAESVFLPRPPAVDLVAGTSFDDAESGASGWEKYASSGASGSALRTARVAGFDGNVLVFEGSGLGDAWRRTVGSSKSVATMAIQTVEDFKIFFYVETDAGRRVVRYSTVPGDATASGSTVIVGDLPATAKNGVRQTLVLRVRDALESAGRELRRIDQIRIRANNLRVDDIAFGEEAVGKDVDVGKPAAALPTAKTSNAAAVAPSTSTAPPSISISALTGDNLLSDAERGRSQTISGVTSNVADGETVSVTADGRTYEGTVKGGVWSVTVPAEDVARWPEAVDIDATVRGTSGLSTSNDARVERDTSGGSVASAKGGATGPLKAFPGALGYAATSTVGGRGGKVLVVNTLRDVVDPNDGLMSLREAMTHTAGPRTVVFEVGGVFEISPNAENLPRILLDDASDSFLTVACHTAPSPGVVIKSGGIRISGSVRDVIMRHCRVRNIDEGRPGSNSGRNITAASTSGNRNLIFDHMSLSWSTDEAFQVYSGPSASGSHHKITLSNSIVAEGDADSSHGSARQDWYKHSEGPSCLSNSKVGKNMPRECSIVNNFIAQNSSRNGIIWGGSGEVSNNIVYNWYDNALQIIPYVNSPIDARATNNLVKRGPQTTSGSSGPVVAKTYGRGAVSASGNYTITRPSGSVSSAQRIADVSSGTVSLPVGTPSTVSILDMAAAGSDHMRCLGASLPARDEIDARVLSEFYNGTGSIGIFDNDIVRGSLNATSQRDYSMYASGRHGANHDTDRDGMPDVWEAARGTNPRSHDANGDDDRDGYTNIEEYLADLAAEC